MRKVFSAFLGAAMFALPFPHAAAAQDQAVYVVTYLETMPQSAEAAVLALKAEVAARRADDGNQAVLLLREIGRDNRFALFEIWKDRSAFDAHEKAPHMRRLQDEFNAIETAPPDERVLSGFWLGPAANHPPAQAVWVLTHVDVMPAYQDQTAALLKALGEGSIQEQGYLLFTVMQQVGRLNHFTVEEGWESLLAFEVHQAATQTRQFRDKLGPLQGALYDQRIYRVLN